MITQLSMGSECKTAIGPDRRGWGGKADKCTNCTENLLIDECLYGMLPVREEMN